MAITDTMNAWVSDTLYDGKPIDAQADSGGDAAPAPALVIAASSNGDGTFTITGSGFTATDTAHIRCADDKAYQVWGNAPTSGGRFTFTTGNVCMNPGGNRYFSANDGSANPSDLTGTHWSNTVTVTCDPAWGQAPDDPDDPPDPPDPPDPAPADPPEEPSAPADP